VALVDVDRAEALDDVGGALDFRLGLSVVTVSTWWPRLTASE
jgi:hypothetical protein